MSGPMQLVAIFAGRFKRVALNVKLRQINRSYSTQNATVTAKKNKVDKKL